MVTCNDILHSFLNFAAKISLFRQTRNEKGKKKAKISSIFFIWHVRTLRFHFKHPGNQQM